MDAEKPKHIKYINSTRRVEGIDLHCRSSAVSFAVGKRQVQADLKER